MADPITESVVAQAITPEVSHNIGLMQFIVANAFTIVGGVFSMSFMILVFFIFVKALRGSDLQDLFTGEVKKELSMTKFWTNVAYFAATVAFLAANLVAGATGESMVLIWLIYLGVVASNAVASKWLVLKYNIPGSDAGQYQGGGSIPTPPSPPPSA